MSQVVIKGKNIDIPEPLYDYVEKKMGKLDRHLEKITAITVELSAEARKAVSDRQVVQVTMLVNGQILRAEESAADMFVAVDAAVDKLQRSAERYKAKLYRRAGIRKSRKEHERSMEAPAPPAEEGELEDDGINHTKRFPIKPMSPAEATEQMELLGHDFYIFYNEDTDGVNVVYKRRAGGYGLLIPELA